MIPLRSIIHRGLPSVPLLPEHFDESVLVERPASNYFRCGDWSFISRLT